MSEKDGGKEKETKTRVWWQDKLEEQERTINALRVANEAKEPARTLVITNDRLKRQVNEIEQKIARLEKEIARVDVAAGNLLKTHEDARAIIENFDSYVNNYHDRRYAPQIVALGNEMQRAEQKYRRAR